MIINLAREIDAPDLLPSAFYDLARLLPSQSALGYQCPKTSVTHNLCHDDLARLLRGREHGSRFLSTFIVNELEGRDPSQWCQHRTAEDPIVRRTCQIAFEAVTFELLRDVNGVVCQRSSDPLFAIYEAEAMLQREDTVGPQGKLPYRACEVCQSEFSMVVDNARREFWRKLPEWFDIKVSLWVL